MPYNTINTDVQDSLANMPSGMTFAQKARAAELNASKRRKAAREAEDEVPELAPVSLGALKFTKRHRGKGSQAKTLDELTEEEDPPSNAQLASSHTIASLTPQDDRLRDQYHRGANTTPTVTPGEAILPPHLRYSPSRSDLSNDLCHKAITTSQSFNDNYAHWSPDMARQAGYGRFGYGTASSTPVSSHPPSRQSSAVARQAGPQDFNPSESGMLRQSHKDNYFPKNHSGIYGQSNRQGSSPEGTQNRAGKENDYSSVHSVGYGTYENPYNSSMDDPFVNQAYLSAYNKGPHQKPALNQRAAVRMPPAVKGTLDRAYRFPTGSDLSNQSHSTFAQVPPPSLAGQISRQPVEYAESRALNDPKAASKTHVRDPLPYTGFTAPSSKTEMLMQSLENLKIEGEVPSSGRTVLYDPLRQSASRRSSTRTECTVLPSYPAHLVRPNGTQTPDFQRDLLKLSDPLPPMTQQDDHSTSRDGSRYTSSGIKLNEPSGLDTQQSQLHGIYQSSNVSLESSVPNENSSQEEKHAALMAWFSGKNPRHEHVREILERRTTAAQDTVSTSPPPQQRTMFAPIGSGRNGQQPVGGNRGSAASNTDSATAIKAEQRAANDIMASVIANMYEHMLNDPKDPFTRYAQPPAWCIDTTPGGNKSLMGETEWNPPPRVGRDPRYPTTFHEGRPTYFEEVGRGAGRR